MTIEVRGLVARRAVAAGSKSEREAIVIESAGARYVLRMAGAPAFGESPLDALVGRRIRARGDLAGTTLLVTSYEVE